jgi:hypothetical protein
MKLMDDSGFGFFRFMQWVCWYVRRTILVGLTFVVNIHTIGT